MKFLERIGQKVYTISGWFTGKTSGFKNHKTVWNYLNQIDLSTEESVILTRSFRTRIKIEDNKEILQFRISPEDLDEIEIRLIPQISDSIQQKLQQVHNNNTIEIQIKVSNCCNKNCYGCTRYTPI